MDTNTLTILGLGISLGYLIISQNAATRKEHREDIAALRADNAAIRADLAKNNESIAKNNEGIATLNVKFDALNAKVDTLDAKVATFDAKFDNIHKDVADAKNSIARIEGHLFGLEKPAVVPAEQPAAAATR